MTTFVLDYKPESLALGERAVWVSATDGDTPTIQLPVRMLGIDAPELHFMSANEKTPGAYDNALANFLDREGKNLEEGLKKYLKPRLENNASTRQITAGREAFDHFLKTAKERLERVNAQGKPLTPRKLFVMAAEEVFDMNGRLLAYVNAAYTKAERKTIPLPKRVTFNLQMLEDGHAASLLIYPNVPKPEDLKLVQKAVHNARTKKKGFWAQGNRALLAYEFRWVVKMIEGEENGPTRFCGDLSTGDLFTPERYYKALPENRLFFFKEDVSDALKMGFKLKT